MSVFLYFLSIVFLAALALFAVTVTWVKIVLWAVVVVMLGLALFVWWVKQLWPRS